VTCIPIKNKYGGGFLCVTDQSHTIRVWWHNRLVCVEWGGYCGPIPVRRDGSGWQRVPDSMWGVIQEYFDRGLWDPLRGPRLWPMTEEQDDAPLNEYQLRGLVP